MKEYICADCYKFIEKIIRNLEEKYSLSTLDACRELLSQEITIPSTEQGEEIYQIPEHFGGYWDPDNTNLMLALYCMLFPRVKPVETCLRKESFYFYEHSCKGRVGETLNSFNTMFGTETWCQTKSRRRLNLSENSELKEAIDKFRQTYHKPGNFMPLPGSLNYTKEYDSKGWNFLGDFFDVKLSIIQSEWDAIKTAKSNVPLLNLNKEFFAHFSNFGEFCQYFYLDLYFDENSNEVIHVCNHNSRCDLKRPDPFDSPNCTEYIDNATNIIEYRAEKMAEKLNAILGRDTADAQF